MSKELVREKLILDQNIGRETIQILLDGDIIVPDIKPDMSSILQTEAFVHVNRTELSADRVNFMGKMDLQVLYLAKGSSKSVLNMSSSVPIDDFINIEGVTKDMWTEAKAEVANIEYKMVNDRKISYRAVLNVKISVDSAKPCDVVSDISDIPKNQLLKSSVQLSRMADSRRDKFSVKDDINIPSGKANIMELIQCTAVINNKEVKVSQGRVTVTGDLIVSSLYRGDGDEDVIEFIEGEIPLNGIVECPAARDDMYADAELMVESQHITVATDSDGENRVISAEISIEAYIKVYSQENLELLEDAYAINEVLNLKKIPIKYPKLICRNRNQAAVKEVVQLDAHCPDMLQIFKISGIPHLDEIKIIDDKVIAEGAIEVNVLYVAESDETPLYCYRTVLPFRQVIETKGARPSMYTQLDAAVDRVIFSMLSKKEMELKFLLSFNVSVIEEICESVISDIEFNVMDKKVLDNMASMTIYAVQQGDSVWKIAKRFNTAIDDILALNDIENPNKIYPGQKLLILKKVV